MTITPWIVAAVFMLLVGVLFAGIHSKEQELEQKRAQFMVQCMQDHKQYECDVLWGRTADAHAVEDLTNSTAIGLAAGAIAGSAAGRR